jgi:hypothetical protein
MIKNLSRLTGQTLHIVQPSVWKSNYELKYKDELLGTIHKKSVFGIRLIIKLFDNEWEIYRPNFWRSEIAVREKGKENPFASYRRKFFSREGFVFLPRGKRLKIKLGVFKSGYAVYTLSGKCLISFTDKASIKSKTVVAIEESSDLLEEYPWIIVLAWYISQQRKRSGAAA